MDEKKLLRLEKLLDLADQDYTTPEDVASALSPVIEAVGVVRQKLEKKIGDTEELVVKETGRIDRRLSTLAKDSSQGLESLRREIRNVELTPGAPGKDADVEEVAARVLSLAKFPEPIPGKDGSPDSAEDIRNKLELLDGDERLDKSAIKGLEEFFKENTKKDDDGITRIIGANKPLWALNDVNLTGLLVGNTIVWDGTQWVPGSGGGSGGQVNSVVAGAGISVNSTDPVNPIVSSTITQYTDALARGAISLTTTGTSGAATYNSTTGVINVPQYAGTIDGSGTANQITYWVDTDTVGALSTATYPSLTELSYVKGVTSSIQTQLNSLSASDYWSRNTGSGYIYPATLTDRVGIGINAPAAKLEVMSGSTSALNTAFRVDDSAGRSMLEVNDAGFIGVSTAPSSLWKLDFTGQYFQMGSDNTSNDTRTNNTVKLFGTVLPHYANASSPMWVIGGQTTSVANTVFIGGGVTSGANAATGINFATNSTTTGGVGTVRMALSNTLLRIGSGDATTTPAAVTLEGPRAAGGTDIAGTAWTMVSGKATGAANSGDFIFQTGLVTTSGTTIQTATTRMVILGGTGNVGIGLTNPSNPLDVQRNQNALTQTRVINATAGTTSRVAITAQSDVATMTLDTFSSLWTPTGGGDDAVSGARMLANGTGGFSFRVSNAAATIRFYTGATERMRVDAAGTVNLSSLTNGLVKSTSGTLSNATAGTDYQAPITLTTTGTSGAATLIGNTLNIPNYAGGGGGGDVFGPASATDNAIARFDTTTGKLIQNSAVTIADTTGIIAGTQGLTFTGVAAPAYVQGGLVYDTDNESLTFFNNNSNVALQVGQEEWIRVVNNTGSTIANGAVVYLNGASAGMPTIALAQSNAAATTIGAGLTTQSIANGATGYVTCIGIVRGLDTSAFTAGQTVYISSTVAGGLTATAPAAPNYRYRVGIVGVSSATVGTIHVTPSTAALGNGTANQIFGINAAGTAQEVKSITSTTSITVVNAANSITMQRAALTGVVTASANSNTTAFGSFASSVLATALTDETGTGSVVFSNSPTLVTPNLGTPSTLVGTNITGTAAGLTAGTVTTNANLTGDVTSVGNATSIAAGVIVDADVNASAAIAVTKLAALTANRAVVTNGSGFLTVSAATDTEIGYLSGVTSGIQAQINAKGAGTVTSVSGTTNRITVATGTTTPVIDISATFEALLGKVANRIDQNNAATTSAQLATVISDETGSGALVFATSPTLVTPALGTPTALVATNATGTATGLTSGITLALKSATTTVDVSAATAPTSGQVLTATSSTTATWQTPSGGTTPSVQTFTANGTWTKPANLKYVVVRLVGGGGGGGGADASASESNAGAGGGSGGYCERIISAASLASSETVTIGAAGTAGANTGLAGGAGGNTTFGALATGNGGGGGDGSNTGLAGVRGGAGGTAASGNINAKGTPGGNGTVTNTGLGPDGAVQGGNGGSSAFGGGGRGGATGGGGGSATGEDGGNYGAGGGGGHSNNGATAAGGAGSAGFVVVYEYY